MSVLAVLAPQTLPSSWWDGGSLAPRDWVTGAYEPARTRSEAVPQQHKAGTHRLASSPSPLPQQHKAGTHRLASSPIPGSPAAEEVEAREEVMWQCMDEFPEIPVLSLIHI